MFPSNDIPVCLFLESGLFGVLLLSKGAKLPGGVELGGLAVLLMLPLASFKVVTPPTESSRILVIIAAAASEEEKIGSFGRGWFV